MWSSILLLAGSVSAAAGAPVYKHEWGTVGDMMAMHGQGANVSDPSVLAFAATHYGQITTAAPCNAKGHTMEDLTLDVDKEGDGNPSPQKRVRKGGSNPDMATPPPQTK